LFLNRGTAFMIFAVAIFIVAAHSAIAAMALPRTSLSPRTKSTIPFMIAAFLGSWLALAIIVGDGANFPIPLESRRSASGLAALMALMVARNCPNAFKWAVAWNLFGMLDLIVASATALYFEARVLSIYPLNLVPLFLGPPLGILTHIYSLRNLAVNTTA